MKKAITKREFDVNWLTASQFYIELPSNPTSRIIVLGFLYRSIKSGNQIGTLQEIIKGVEQRQLYNLRKANWTVPGSKINKLKLLENTMLQLIIRDRKTDKPTGFTLNVLHKEIMPELEHRIISVQKAMDIRDDILKKDQAKQRTFESVNEIEEVALNICQTFASGRITIYEACTMFDVAWLDFFKWVIGMEAVRQMYEDAVKVAKFVSESQVYSVSINMMLERLKSGYTTNTDIVWDAIWVNGEKRFVEKAKRTNTREITLSELIRVIATLKNESGVPAIDGDEFNSMSDTELWDYVQEIRGRTSMKKLNKDNSDPDENNLLDGQPITPE